MADQNNIGASRLLGTNSLQSAVDSLTSQVSKMTTDVSQLTSSMNNLAGSNNKSMGGTSSNSARTTWNGSSNSNKYSSNGGGGSFSNLGTSQSGGRGNGGFGNSKLGATLSAGSAIGSALAQYGNKNMSTNMQMDYFGTTQAQYGGIGSGGFQQANAAARSAVFGNNYLGTSVNDMAQAGYINSYTFGQAAQLNGQANPLFTSQMSQVQGFGYNSPTLGSTGAAQAAQQTYTARALGMSQALGIAPTITTGGVKTPMGVIAQSIMNKALTPGKQYTTKNIAAALGQGGGLGTTLNYYGQQMGWSQSTIQEYQNYMIGQVSAQAKGISSSQYETLTSQAANGNKTAQKKLQSAGVGSSMYEAQRNLNSTGTTRQNDILNTLSPAFDKTTSALNNLSGILTTLMNKTGMSSLLGMGAGIASPLSNSLSGFSGAFSAGAGMYGAMKLFGGAGSLLGGLSGLFGGGSAATGMTASAAGANGVYNITSMGAAGSTGLLARLLPGLGAVGAVGLAGATTAKTTNNIMNKNGSSTSAFTSYMDKYMNKSVTDRDAVANAWFSSHPGASVDTSMMKLLLGSSYKPPVSSGVNGGASSAPTGGVGGSSSNGSSSGGASAASVIRFAETQLGVPYVWGGEQPGRGFDCSGLTQWAYKQAGVTIPRVASAQQKTGKSVPVNQTQPGDLLFMGDPAYHVVMAIGGGKVIEAPHTGSSVNIETLIPSQYSSATRIVGSVGNMSSLLNGSTTTPTTLNQQQSTSGGNLGNFGGGTSEADVVASALAGSMGGMPLVASAMSAGSASGTSATGVVPKGNGNNSKASLQAYAKQLLTKYGWAGQWAAFNNIEMSEAGWDYKATNPTSGAYGLAQALPASKMSSAGADWRTNGDTQLQWMMQYIKGRYGDPSAAWSFHQKNNWYAAGAWSIDKDQNATVHQGEMIIPAAQAETIRQTLLNNSFNPNLAKSSSGSTFQFGNINITLPSSFTGTQPEVNQLGKAIADAAESQLRVKNLQMGQ